MLNDGKTLPKYLRYLGLYPSPNPQPPTCCTSKDIRQNEVKTSCVIQIFNSQNISSFVEI